MQDLPTCQIMYDFVYNIIKSQFTHTLTKVFQMKCIVNLEKNNWGVQGGSRC